MDFQERDVGATVEVAVSLDSVALERLIEEVETDEPLTALKYNRTYNRHNR